MRKNNEKALDYYEQAVQTFKKATKPNYEKLGTVLNNMGFVYISQNKNDKALQKCKESCYSFQKANTSPDHSFYKAALEQFKLLSMSTV